MKLFKMIIKKEIKFFKLFARNLRKLADEITIDTLFLIVLIDLLHKVNKMKGKGEE